MKLYDYKMAPNPRRVRVFAAEKGFDIPLVDVDLGAKARPDTTQLESNNPRANHTQPLRDCFKTQGAGGIHHAIAIYWRGRNRRRL